MQSLDQEHRNVIWEHNDESETPVNFWLNIGYNDHYKKCVNPRIGFWNSLKFLIFRGSYQSIFKNKYNSLLSAIEEMRYDQLEELWEQRLLKKLASDIYSLTNIEKCDFEIKNPSSKIELKIINYNKVIVPERGDEPIENYYLEHISRNTWEVLYRNSDDEEMIKLENRLKLKNHYMINPAQVDSNMQEPILMTKQRQQSELYAIVEDNERSRMKNIGFIDKDIEKSFKSHCTIEYNLFKKLMPGKITKGKQHYS